MAIPKWLQDVDALDFGDLSRRTRKLYYSLVKERKEKRAVKNDYAIMVKALGKIKALHPFRGVDALDIAERALEQVKHQAWLFEMNKEHEV